MKTNRFVIAALLAATASLAACDFTEGEEGNLTFRDMTLGDVDLDDNIATGATLVVNVSCVGCPNDDVTDAWSSDPNVLEVVSFAGDEVTVRGLAPGAADLEVRVGSTSDRVRLSVEDAVDASIRLMPWPSLAELPTTLWDAGFASLPDTSFEVRAFPRDAGGQRTTGFGAVTWTVDGDATVSDQEARSSDTVVLTAGPQPGTFTLTPSLGEPLTIETVAVSDVASVSLYSAASDGVVLDDGDTLTMEADESLILHLSAFTADGAYVAGDGGEPATFELGQGAEGLLEDILDTLAEDPEDTDEVRQSFPRGFLLGATGDLGTGTLTFSWADQTLTLTLEVVPPSDTDQSGG